MITREQLKMARAGLNWTIRDLARRSGVSLNSITRYENGRDAYNETLTKLRRTLEKGGILFLDGNGDGPGVRLRARR
ncbi:MAG TPA: helix-turn-helix transcriptional regulator [Stellaceae bacterium]|nr:helix-turn-helix transcriptional regulator [Stellaceae bacterium]